MSRMDGVIGRLNRRFVRNLCVLCLCVPLWTCDDASTPLPEASPPGLVPEPCNPQESACRDVPEGVPAEALQRIPFVAPLPAGASFQFLNESLAWANLDPQTGELLITAAPPKGEYLFTLQILDGSGAPVSEHSLRVAVDPTTAAVSPLPNYILGYTTVPSVAQGSTLPIHVSTDVDSFSVDIYRFGVNKSLTPVYHAAGIPGQAPVSRAAPYGRGAGWPLAHAVPVSADWESGLYRAILRAGEAPFSFEFVVRPQAPGTAGKVLVLDNAPTVQAYNAWGGRSLYPRSGPTGPIARAAAVSFERPTPRRVQSYTEFELIAWLEKEGISYESASLMDLQNNPELLGAYQVVIIVGHSEYWSREMRARFDAFLARGGNAMILSGNTMWWQIRIENGRIVCYKSATMDPLAGSDNDRVTVNFFASPVNDPEERSIGLSFRHAGFVNHAGILPYEEGHGGYTVEDAGHWAFAGADVQTGTQFGRPSRLVGYEVDGAPLAWVDGHPVITTPSDTPADYRIIAWAKARDSTGKLGYATPGLFQYAGAGCVFNAATVNWTNGLADDVVVQTLTRNVLARFSVPGAGCY